VKIFIIKQDTRSRSAPEEFLNSHMSSLYSVSEYEQEPEQSENNNYCPSPLRVSKNSKITNYRSKAYRQNSTIVEETKFRRTKTATEFPWEGVFINPLELIIPSNIRPLGKGFFW